MYLHLGNNYVITAKSIIAILNIQTPYSEDVNDIMHVAIDNKNLVNISEDGKEKALVICDDYVYISPISSTTLYKRSFNQIKEV
ncbi:MAG TPA: extracellular matrix/biofilm biosynthesis regulator RemA family protein [Syntrophomonadaceae bacterium]|nr:extracellular matrix/biofilm biosynthesis regulator RemA family protein [Syntrophomonadaceae bacterium]